MAIQIDQQFIEKLKKLTQEVLRDEAKFWSRNDLRYEVLHNRIFSKTNQTGFAGLPEEDQKKFKKYFYIDETGTTPRLDVPFAGSKEEQAFFFDQFHNQVKACTYNFERMDFLKPNFSDEKDEEPDFSAAQSDLMLRGVIYPLIHGLEQKEIALVEKRKASGPAAAGPTPNNPYAGLGDRILVKGVSGEFDTILTFDQLQEISDEEKEIRKSGVSEEEVARLLREYVRQRYPQLFLDEHGKITTFTGAQGVSAVADKKQQGVDLQVRSFNEILDELQARQGRKLQYDAVQASNGTLGFSPAEFQVSLGGGESVTLEGMTLSLTHGGEQNAVCFVTDNQGVSARISADVAQDRISDDANLEISIYDDPGKDDPTNPQIELEPEDLALLGTPLRPLYRRLQETGEYRPEGGKTVIVKLPPDRRAPELPAIHLPPENATEQSARPGAAAQTLSGPPTPVTDRYTINFIETTRRAAPATAPGVRGRTATLSTRPKIEAMPSSRAAEQPASPAPESAAPRRPASATVSGRRQTIEPESADQSESSKPKSMFPKIALAAGLPIAGIGASIFGAAIKIFTNFT
jgi:hypothetical protein